MRKHTLIRLQLGLLFALLFIPSGALLAEMEFLGRLSGIIGAERESNKQGSTAGGGHFHASPEAMVVLPIPFTPVGIQANGSFVGGDGDRRWGFSAGPIVGWDGPVGGKAGLFFVYQNRHYFGSCASTNNSLDFHQSWIRAATAFYLPNVNVDAWISQTLSPRTKEMSCEEDHIKAFQGVNQARVMVNYFPPVVIPFLASRPGNLEVSLGVDTQNLWGAGLDRLGPSIGPAFGIAFMPLQNLEVMLFRAFYDVNQGKYKVNSGLHYYLNFWGKNPTPTLLELRRKYLEPTLEPGNVNTTWGRKF
jgi:hypothetical protein